MTGFICQDEYLAKCAKLSDQEVGRLFRALMQYHATGIEPELAGRESIAFDFIRDDIDKAEKAYAAKCEKNRQNRLITNDNERGRTITNVDERAQNNNINNIKRVSKETQNAHTRELFDRFWSAYPRHTGKQAAEKAFLRLNPDDDLLGIMLKAITAWSKSEQWTKDGGQFIPHPATWLNGKRWEDELPKAAGPHVKTVTAQQYNQRDYTEEDLDTATADLIAEAQTIKEVGA
jgi:hypothetical protein